MCSLRWDLFVCWHPLDIKSSEISHGFFKAPDREFTYYSQFVTFEERDARADGGKEGRKRGAAKKAAFSVRRSSFESFDLDTDDNV